MLVDLFLHKAVGVIVEAFSLSSTMAEFVSIYQKIEVLLDFLLSMIAYAAFVSVASVHQVILNQSNDSKTITSVVFMALSWAILCITWATKLFGALRDCESNRGGKSTLGSIM